MVFVHERSKRYSDIQPMTVTKATARSRCLYSRAMNEHAAPINVDQTSIGRNMSATPKSMYDSAAYPNAMSVLDSSPATITPAYLRTSSLSDLTFGLFGNRSLGMNTNRSESSIS